MTALSRNEPLATFKPAGNKDAGLLERRADACSLAFMECEAMH